MFVHLTECCPGFYGLNCEGVCSDYCQFPPCIATSLTGECRHKACLEGYHGDNCQGISVGTCLPLSGSIIRPFF